MLQLHKPWWLYVHGVAMVPPPRARAVDDAAARDGNVASAEGSHGEAQSGTRGRRVMSPPMLGNGAMSGTRLTFVVPRSVPSTSSTMCELRLKGAPTKSPPPESAALSSVASEQSASAARMATMF